ncbi:hypothetical protein PIB30_083100 [Stylosanthes scabra]|uniref:Uncharacterized protein n=1 Tax=Stylosanthes scabra TaxID=79078 RepID=A0ABU6WQG7_9FABA|nr:hypothetical protein [Stylosanthes scabra]
MGGINPVPNVLCIQNNVEPRSQQNLSKSRITGKNSPWCVCTIVCCASSSAGTRKLRAQLLAIAWAAPVLLVSCLRSFKAAWAALLVLMQLASNSTSNNPSFLVFLHESFASNALFSLSKSFLNP